MEETCSPIYRQLYHSEQLVRFLMLLLALHLHARESEEIYYIPVYSILQQRISISFMRKVLNYQKHASHDGPR